MIVVSNTSPLTNLAAIGQFDLLQRLFGRIDISEGVWSELNAAGKRWPGSVEVEGANWIERHAVQRLGLNVMGVVGVLLLAHARNEIDHIKPFLDALRHVAGFYLGEELYQAVLAQVKESL